MQRDHIHSDFTQRDYIHSDFIQRDMEQKEMGCKKFTHLPRRRIEEIFKVFSEKRVLVIGDGALDIYWKADMTKSRLSRETPHFPLPVVEERIGLGGGANVARNLAVLGVERVDLITVIGDDWRGREFRKIAGEQGIKTGGLVTAAGRFTPAYCKPVKQGLSEEGFEDTRIDFINETPLTAELEEEVLGRFRHVFPGVDALVIVDQLTTGVVTERVRGELVNISREKLAVVDSRDNIALFKNIIIKPNQLEAARAAGAGGLEGRGDWLKIGSKLRAETGAPVVITLGAGGALWIDSEQAIEIPTVPAEKPVDIVGAGDCFLAAFVTAAAAGALAEEALFIGNLAAGVSVKKLQTTGSAARKEILAEYDRNYGGDQNG